MLLSMSSFNVRLKMDLRKCSPSSKLTSYIKFVKQVIQHLCDTG
jgi:hypothetical protein